MALLTNRGVWMLGLPVAIVLLPLLLLVTIATSAPIPSLVLPTLVPAFAWSNHRELDSHLPRISYETIAAEDLVETVKREIVWPGSESAQLHEGEGFVEQDADLDVVLVFVGTRLRSGDVSRVAGPRSSDLLQVLNRVVTSSNSSVSLPYVTPPRDGESVTDALVKEIVGGVEEEEEEDRESRLGEVITTGACVRENAPRTKRFSLNALLEYLPVRMSTRLAGRTDLVVVCCSSGLGNSAASEGLSEGEVLDGMLLGLDEMRTRYVALYTTDLSGAKAFQPRPRGRKLYADEEYCNEVCQTKAIVLEGLLVGLTLLIILISGLCCMAGITTPNRFEQNKDGQ